MAELARRWADHGTVNTRLMAWRVLLALPLAREATPEVLPRSALLRRAGARPHAARSLVGELFLLEELAAASGRSTRLDRCQRAAARDREPVQEVMLRNLKARVGWVEKKVNCDFLVAAVQERRGDGRSRSSYFANEVVNHLANLLKVSRVEGTRFHAGRCLLRLLPVLTVTQRNDLIVELLRSLAARRRGGDPLHPALPRAGDRQSARAGVPRGARRHRGRRAPRQRAAAAPAAADRVWVLLSLDVERLAGRRAPPAGRHASRRARESRASTTHEGFARRRDGARPPGAQDGDGGRLPRCSS